MWREMAERPDEWKTVFGTLRPLCARLLELPASPNLQEDPFPSLFQPLANALRQAPLPALQTCFEYVLFPLQLLLDAAINCRLPTPPSPSSSVAPHIQTSIQSRLPISDKIAEGVLFCLRELLQLCPLKDTSQITLLLEKLTAAIMLSPTDAAEEFRHGAVLCLKSLLVGLNPCGRMTCSCKLGLPPSTVSFQEGCLKAALYSLPNRIGTENDENFEESGESSRDCMSEFLQSEEMAVVVGHLFSLLLQTAETEAKRGSLGNTKLRIDALSTLRVLILKVGAADSLAFFLPGVVSGLAKVVRSTKTLNEPKNKFLVQPSYPKGAAGSPGAVEEGLRGMAELLVLVLADDKNVSIKEGLANSTSKNEQISVDSAWSMLCKYSLVQNNEQNRSNTHDKYDDIDLHDNGISKLGIIAPVQANTSLEDKRLRVVRTGEWLQHTVAQVNTILSLTLPPICSHPTQSVRLALAELAGMLLITSAYTLEGCRYTLLECLLALACDDWPQVARAAHLSLEYVASNMKPIVEDDFRNVLRRLIESLPRTLFLANEEAALRLSRQLAAAMFFAGPDAVSQCFFHSPAASCHFISIMTQCLGFTSAFTGLIGQLTIVKGNTVGYVPGISELATSAEGKVITMDTCLVDSTNNGSSNLLNRAVSGVQSLPKIPPWLTNARGDKFYYAVASILRFAGLCAVTGSSTLLFSIVDELLDSLRKISFQLETTRTFDDSKSDWYTLLESGKLTRSAATAVCVLNEIIYGASGYCLEDTTSLFQGIKPTKRGALQNIAVDGEFLEKTCTLALGRWKCLALHGIDKVLAECISNILHEYMSDNVWSLPIDAASGFSIGGSVDTLVPSHIFQDNLALYQVILEGIGIFSMALGKVFEESGLLVSSLYVLLENLGSPNYHVSRSADLSLHAIQAQCGHSSVKTLVTANADYIIDSLCRQLRHLPLYPNVPNMLVAVLRYTDAADNILPLLKEPISIISLELEIPGRQQHPSYTMPMLRALKEIVKAAGRGSPSLEVGNTKDTESSQRHAEKTQRFVDQQPLSVDGIEQKIADVAEALLELKQRKEHRQSIEDILISCLNGCAPLLAARSQHMCLLALDIVQEGIKSLSILNLVAKRERKERDTIGKAADPSDNTILDDEEVPRLLPTMHHIWPHLVSCLKRNEPSVLNRTLEVIASVIYDCGGDFFVRRFQKDVAPQMFKSLCSIGTVKKRISHVRKLTHQTKGAAWESGEEISHTSLLKTQVAMLNCVRKIAMDKRSSTALIGAVRPLVGIAVGLACGYPSLEDAACDTLIALSVIDADLVWVMVADLAYQGISSHSRDRVPPGLDFPELVDILPSLPSSKEALWRQEITEECNLVTDTSTAWSLLSRLDSQCR